MMSTYNYYSRGPQQQAQKGKAKPETKTPHSAPQHRPATPADHRCGTTTLLFVMNHSQRDCGLALLQPCCGTAGAGSLMLLQPCCGTAGAGSWQSRTLCSISTLYLNPIAQQVAARGWDGLRQKTASPL